MMFQLFSASKASELKIGEKMPYHGNDFPQFFTIPYTITVIQKQEAVAHDLALYRDSGHDFYTHSIQEKGKIARGQALLLEGTDDDMRAFLSQMDALENYYGLPRGKEKIELVRTGEIMEIDCFRAHRQEDIPKNLIIGKMVRIN